MTGPIRKKTGIPGYEELNDGKCLRRDWPNLSDFSEIWLDIHKKFPAAGSYREHIRNLQIRRQYYRN